MLRYIMALFVLFTLALIVPRNASAQASKKLRELSSEDAQKKSWEEVDRINREADGTRSRNEQARKSAGIDKQNVTGGNVTKRHVLPGTTKPDTKQADTTKPDSKKQKSAQKKKTG